MRYTKYLLITCFYFSCFTSSLAQKETNIWYFGQRAGLDFSSGNPKVITNSMMTTDEGCATIADRDGNLLFYTNGINVWNRNHRLMPNGYKLMGHRSSTQSAIIVPKPSSSNFYYIFTTDLQSQAYGLRYSLVDMNRQDGLGDVMDKNIFKTSPIAEKITAVKHQNNRDYWVLVHKWNSDAFVAYLISEKGVSIDPIISNIGTTYKGKGSAAIGGMKASPDGRKIGVAVWRDFNRFEVFDFDNATGKLSNKITIEPYPEAYGLEFSPDGSKLYGTTNGIAGVEPQLWQFNLKAGNKLAINSSAILIATSSADKIGALQLGPDGKIYLARQDETFLGVINLPNAGGWSCRYVDQGVSLGERKCKLGLPNFMQSYFIDIKPQY